MLCEEKDELLSEYGIIHCVPEKLAELEGIDIKYKKETPYGTTLMVSRKNIPDTVKVSPISIEELFLFMVKEDR